ncbi:hypothetical protein HK405_003320 [Cladochytrium tenue]|nr:hypothetical protein HK405_003320 [Cladochytrium tenue]
MITSSTAGHTGSGADQDSQGRPRSGGPDSTHNADADPGATAWAGPGLLPSAWQSSSTRATAARPNTAAAAAAAAMVPQASTTLATSPWAASLSATTVAAATVRHTAFPASPQSSWSVPGGSPKTTVSSPPSAASAAMFTSPVSPAPSSSSPSLSTSFQSLASPSFPTVVDETAAVTWRAPAARAKFYPVEDSPYVLPYDMSEANRSHLQAPLLSTGGARVLDMGCGSGSWSMDMGRQFPTATIIAADINPPAERPEKCPNNVSFVTEDVRLMTLALRKESWPSAIKELVRITKPGGYVEILEIGWNGPIGSLGRANLQKMTFAIKDFLSRVFDMDEEEFHQFALDMYEECAAAKPSATNSDATLLAVREKLARLRAARLALTQALSQEPNQKAARGDESLGRGMDNRRAAALQHTANNSLLTSDSMSSLSSPRPYGRSPDSDGLQNFEVLASQLDSVASLVDEVAGQAYQLGGASSTTEEPASVDAVSVSGATIGVNRPGSLRVVLPSSLPAGLPRALRDSLRSLDEVDTAGVLEAVNLMLDDLDRRVSLINKVTSDLGVPATPASAASDGVHPSANPSTTLIQNISASPTAASSSTVLQLLSSSLLSPAMTTQTAATDSFPSPVTTVGSLPPRTHSPPSSGTGLRPGSGSDTSASHGDPRLVARAARGASHATPFSPPLNPDWLPLGNGVGLATNPAYQVHMVCLRLPPALFKSQCD